MMNRVIMTGRFTADPEMKTTASGVTAAVFRLAVDRNYKGPDGERQTDFIPCVAWRQTAELIINHFSKGALIQIEGSMQSRNYTDKNGSKRTAYEVVVEHIYFISGGNAQGTQAPKKPAAPAKGSAGQDILAAAQAQGLSINGWEPLDDENDLPF